LRRNRKPLRLCTRLSGTRLQNPRRPPGTSRSHIGRHAGFPDERTRLAARHRISRPALGLRHEQPPPLTWARTLRRNAAMTKRTVETPAWLRWLWLVGGGLSFWSLGFNTLRGSDVWWHI